MGTVAGGDLFWRRRPKEVETDTVAGDSCQQSAFRAVAHILRACL